MSASSYQEQSIYGVRHDFFLKKFTEHTPHYFFLVCGKLLQVPARSRLVNKKSRRLISQLQRQDNFVPRRLAKRNNSMKIHATFPFFANSLFRFRAESFRRRINCKRFFFLFK